MNAAVKAEPKTYRQRCAAGNRFFEGFVNEGAVARTVVEPVE